MLCDCSERNEIELYCEVHDDVICQSCKIVKHRKCQTLSVKDKSASFLKPSFNSVVEEASQVMKDTDDAICDRQNVLQNISAMEEKCKDDIKLFRRDLNNLLDMAEEMALKETEDKAQLQRTEVDSELTTLSITKDMLYKDKKLLKKAEDSKETSNMFAVFVKVSKRVMEYENLLTEMRLQDKPPNLSFERNKDLVGLEDSVKTLGSLFDPTFNKDDPERQSQKLFTELKIDISSKLEIDLKLAEDRHVPRITGCVFMPDNQVVICDETNRCLKLISSAYKVTDNLRFPNSPWDVSALDQISAICSLPEMKQLNVINLKPRLQVKRKIDLDKRCWGVEYVRGKLYVSCFDIPGDGEVKILDLNGKQEKQLSSVEFKYPFYLTVGANTDRVYVSDSSASIACLKSNGSAIYHYRGDSSDTRGFCVGKIRVDCEGNILVCKLDSGIFVITADRKKQINLVSSAVTQNPNSVALSHTTGTLIVGSDKLYVFKVG